MAAAAWSCVEKMLHEAQRISAPSAFSVSISTAVWMVMCSEPVMRAPFSGCDGPNSSRVGHQAGHFRLGDVDLLAAVIRKLDVSYFVVGHSALLGDNEASRSSGFRGGLRLQIAE